MSDFHALRLVFSVTRERSVRILRILIAVKPRAYREVITLFLHQRRPTAEVLISPADSLDGEVRRFKPHLIVYTEGDVQDIPTGVLCRVR